jgi:hypothetical protein
MTEKIEKLSKEQREYLEKSEWPCCVWCEHVNETGLESYSRIVLKCKFDNDIVNPIGQCRKYKLTKPTILVLPDSERKDN